MKGGMEGKMKGARGRKMEGKGRERKGEREGERREGKGKRKGKGGIDYSLVFHSQFE